MTDTPIASAQGGQMTQDKLSEESAWPLGGYAPGHYMCQCVNCGEPFEGDKGAVQVRSKVRALLTATALETLSAELERVKGERDEAREEVARYWTSADMTPWVELAESKGLGHFGKKLKGMFNRAINAEARAERAEASLGVAETEIICLNKMLGDARKALEPFAHAVFNDNGDVTLDMSDIGTKDYLRARSALASIQAKGE